jgi:hypothetical protein
MAIIAAPAAASKFDLLHYMFRACFARARHDVATPAAPDLPVTTWLRTLHLLHYMSMHTFEHVLCMLSAHARAS